MNLKRTVKAVIWRDEPPWYVAECHDIGVVTQGRTLDEVAANLREAVDLYFEDEDPHEFGFAHKPIIASSPDSPESGNVKHAPVLGKSGYVYGFPPSRERQS